jgi:ABC-2 type transport system ATP-binding protein
MLIASNLVKDYGTIKAVAGLNLTVEKGTFFGLLGPNGAGKTTTLKMMSMLLNPTSGDVLIDGVPIDRRNKKLKSTIGIVTQHLSLQRELTVYEVLIHHGMLHGMKRRAMQSRIDALITFAKMKDQLNQEVQHLSGGNKRKLMILKSVMHHPKLIFLDEPTVGLDVAIRRDIWDLLKALKTEGLTIIMTTHYIEEAYQLCDEIGMMNRGVLLKIGTPSAFMGEITPFVLENFDGQKTHYHYFETREAALDNSRQLSGAVTIRQSTLEDVYIQYTGERNPE